MRKIIIVLLSLIMSPAVTADQNSDEYRLLKSWGFQFNAQGKLIFNAMIQQGIQYQPWRPDLSGYRAGEFDIKAQKKLDPLVISAKKKGEK